MLKKLYTEGKLNAKKIIYSINICIICALEVLKIAPFDMTRHPTVQQVQIFNEKRTCEE